MCWCLENATAYFVSSTVLIARSAFHPGAGVPVVQFTDREKIIIMMICEERTNEEIGQAHFINPWAVERIRAGIMDKIGAKTPAGVVIYAQRSKSVSKVS